MEIEHPGDIYACMWKDKYLLKFTLKKKDIIV